MKSNFVDILIYKEKPEDLSRQNISEGGASIVIPDSKNIFPKINDTVTLQVNLLFVVVLLSENHSCVIL